MAQTGPVSRRNRPAKPALSQAAIVAAALVILDADGLDAVSMRRVAQALDTGAASLYVYVRNRDELLNLLLDQIAGEIPLPDLDVAEDGWRAQLATLIADSIQVFGRHRGIATVAFANVPTGPNALAIAERTLALLKRSGISRQARAFAADVIALYVTAAGTEETIYQEKSVSIGQTEAQTVSYLEQSLGELSAEAYPNILELRGELVSGSGDQRARWAIDVLINGILATAVDLS